jgi:hypothetical protein
MNKFGWGELMRDWSWLEEFERGRVERDREMSKAMKMKIGMDPKDWKGLELTQKERLAVERAKGEGWEMIKLPKDMERRKENHLTGWVKESVCSLLYQLTQLITSFIRKIFHLFSHAIFHP